MKKESGSGKNEPETWYLEFSTSDTVFDVKEALAKLSGIPIDSQKLIYSKSGKQLEDTKTLEFYNLEHEAIKLVNLGKETQTLGECKVDPLTQLYFSTKNSDKGQLLVEASHFGTKGEHMKAEHFIEKEATISLVTNKPSKSKHRKGDSVSEMKNETFPLKITRLDNGKAIEIKALRLFTLRKVLEMVKEADSAEILQLYS